MQTLPNPPLMQRVFKKAHHLNLPNSSIVVLELKGFTGSCCDSGRLQVAECGQWWYQCPNWGLKVRRIKYSIVLCGDLYCCAL